MLWTERHPETRAIGLTVGALAACAWLSLVAWDLSPHDRYLDHSAVDELNLAGPAAVGIFVGGWVLMILAMMLPTTYPVVGLFGEVVAGKDDRRRLLALCVVGYLAVWTAFGAAVYLLDLGLHAAVDRVGWIDDNSPLVAAGVLALAGAYQFTSLKYRCLTECRSPRMFVMRHWTGRHPRRDALGLGLDHGLFCLGCCWTLMLLMFAVGAGSVPVMFALGAVMAVEKNVSWGRSLSWPLGVALLAGAALVALAG